MSLKSNNCYCLYEDKKTERLNGHEVKTSCLLFICINENDFLWKTYLWFFHLLAFDCSWTWQSFCCFYLFLLGKSMLNLTWMSNIQKETQSRHFIYCTYDHIYPKWKNITDYWTLAKSFWMTGIFATFV